MFIENNVKLKCFFNLNILIKFFILLKKIVKGKKIMKIFYNLKFLILKFFSIKKKNQQQKYLNKKKIFIKNF